MADNNPTASSPSPLDYQNRKNDQFDSSNYNVSNLQFPKDLTSADNAYGDNFIVFYVNVQTDSKVKLGDKFDEAAVGEGFDPKKSSGAKPGSQSSQDTRAGVTAAVGVNTFGVTAAASFIAGSDVAKAAGNGAKAGGLAAASTGIVMSQAASANRSTRRLKSAISLHNPNMIAIRYSTDWSNADTAKESMMMGDFGGTTLDPTSIDSFMKTAKTAGGGAIGALTNMALTNGPNKDLLSAKSGLAANAKKEMIFKGVEFRSFNFDYVFAPRSPEEYINAQNIIKMFKFHMHPEYVPGRGNYLYLYPSEFDIIYYNNGNENRNLPRYTSCVLTGMSVQYTPNGNFTSFSGGAPTQINISLEFKELTTLTKAEIADGY